MIEILSEEKRTAIKKLLHVKDVGLTDFNYGCICNHIQVKTNKITGFQGEGVTDSIAVLNLITDIWQDLCPEEKLSIKEILE